MYPPFVPLFPVNSNLGSYGALVPYGSLVLTDSSPSQAFVEPLTTDEVRSYLKLPVRSPADPAEEDTLSGMITAARMQAEILQNRDLVRKQWDLSMDYWPLSYHIDLRDPLISVDLVQYRDYSGAYYTQTENVDYLVDKSKHPGLVSPMYNRTFTSFTPWPSSALLVRFTSGFASDSVFWQDRGSRIKVGMKMLISWWFFNRIPVIIGRGVTDEYPWTITACLKAGALARVK